MKARAKGTASGKVAAPPRRATKDLAYYMALPYTFTISRDKDTSGVSIKVNELPGCISSGDTSEEALERIEEAMELWISVALEDGKEIPEPDQEFSGRILVRLPRNVHRDLIRMADSQGVSLNLFCATTLSRAVGEMAVVGQ